MSPNVPSIPRHPSSEPPTHRLLFFPTSSQTAMNPINTVFDAKRMIGRKFSDAQIQADINDWSYKVVAG